MNRFRMAMQTYAHRTLILTHRYLGIAISLMLVVWFASGIVMMYAGGMPRIDPQMRLDRLPALDFSRIKLTPSEAAQRLGRENASVPTLLMVQERPAYRFQGPGVATVFADDGSQPERLQPAAAAEVARRYAQVSADVVHFDRQVDEVDQWTMGGGRRDLPLYKFRIKDGRGTQLYVSPRSAEVIQATTTWTRALAWIGTIPHWIYFSSLRTNQPLWYRIVVWLSALASGLAVLGLVLAYTQFRKTRPFRLTSSIPYRGGMRWHYISGALFGVFVFTWAFSGLMSMEPWERTNANGLEIDRAALTGGRPDITGYPSLNGPALTALAAPRVIKEISYQRIQGEHYYNLRTAEPQGAGETKAERLHQPYVVGGRGEQGRLLVKASDLQRLRGGFSTQSIVERIQTAVPTERIVELKVLEDYDSYYYSRGGQAVLPVLRIKFGDPMRTWIYVDPLTSSVVAQVHKYSRVERWLYNGLHSLDFAFWYSRRPLWDIGMILLLLGGLTSSTLGLCYGVRRLMRNALSVKIAGGD
jgi:hypothetical protein